ncbi:hypothetical protein [Prosthecobacter sp.]|uniref:hypothetical protein n=1 Tax=Prosthecobacter sp. TaxID=1965333 RepID=UPI002ABC32FC|nr:hypothetical protein [Prosthecobacter sp.]MDZ4401356.1 hypothetical protein [Prosthecobacter sp.]
MSEEPSAIAVKTGVSVAWVICGVLFIVLWIIAHVAWGMMSLMANVMANDSGAASGDTHMTLIVGMLGGQILAGGAGIPAGLAFFWRGRRKLLLWLFAALFASGALIQAGVFWSFFSSMP